MNGSSDSNDARDRLEFNRLMFCVDKYCEARPGIFGEGSYAICTSFCAPHCPWAFGFGDGFFCRHPRRSQIVSRTHKKFIRESNS